MNYNRVAMKSVAISYGLLPTFKKDTEENAPFDPLISKNKKNMMDRTSAVYWKLCKFLCKFNFSYYVFKILS